MYSEEQEETKGKLEQIEEQVCFLLTESKDPAFTEYLQKLSQRVIQQKYQADLLQAELERSYQMYQNRQECVQAQEQMQMPEEEPAEPAGYTKAVVWNAAAPVPPKKRNTEFEVGAVLLSIVGGAFILTAFVMLGMNYMNGFVRGMSLYAISAVLLAVSEFFIYRRWQGLGSALSAVGIGGLYLSTVINYLALHNFPGWVAMLVIGLILLFVVLLSRKRNSALYRILGLIAGYLCFIPVNTGIQDVEFLAVVGMIFAVNVIAALLPTQKYRGAVNILHMVANVLFAQVFLWRAEWCGITSINRMVFLLTSLAVMQLLFLLQVRKQKENTEGVQVVYCIGSLLYLSMIFSGYTAFDRSEKLFFYGIMSAILLICLAAFFGLFRYREKWYIYTFANLAVIVSARFIGTPASVILWLLLLAVLKLLSLRKPPVLVRINDVVLTTLVCMASIAMKADVQDKRILANSAMLLAGVLFSIPFVSYFRTYFELLLTYTVAWYVALSVPPLLELPMFVGVLFAGVLLFNNVKRWRGKNIIILNVFVLMGQVACFLLLARPVYLNAYITYFCMLVFGLAVIVIMFQEKYQMNLRCKEMIVSVFLTYMAFIVKTQVSVINSILMMLIALVSVAVGFIERKKSVRIYGLVLSLLLCGKIVLYDFIGAATLQKTVLFFAVGVIALVIAGIYIVLEKKSATNSKEEISFDSHHE